MSLSFAHWFLYLVAAYLSAGIAFVVVVWVTGLVRIDRAATGASWGARALVTPGLILLWPALLGRWRRGRGDRPVEDTAHRRAEVRS